ncbi:MAG: hypothetical protein GF364_15355 [Candidatus Lokiarchaeota archaeon]|nr:hypothetical protein [Candidatus Lokiarchaeota archaeon]
MKLNRTVYSKTIICLFILNILLLSDNSLFTQTRREDGISEKNDLAVFGSVDAEKIHIIGSNWSLAVQESWCSGSGSQNDPYVLEDLEIDCENQYSGIIIENSSKYFEIRNCTLSNIGSVDSNAAGIRLVNTSYGTLYQNNFSTQFEGNYGIHLANESNYNKINNNSILELENGIYLNNDCNNNSIINNKIVNATGYGIYSLAMHPVHNLDNRFCGNNITNCEDTALYLVYSHHSRVENNFIVNSSNKGIYLEWCDNSNVTNNIISDSFDDGIQVRGWYNNIIENNINISGASGIEIRDRHYNLVYGNLINNSAGYGIAISDCSYNTIKQNIVNNSFVTINVGFNSHYNNISKNYFGYSSLSNAFEVDGANGNNWNTSIAGNYWVDYTDSDSDGDGIGDSLYNISDNEPAADFKPITGEFFYDGSVIQIDSTEVLYNNWTYTGSRYWCSGTGTKEDPFLIEDLQINAQNSSCGVDIRESDKNFKLVNLTITNSSGEASEHSGICLYSTDNGQIINSSIYNNGLYGSYPASGIEISESENITISNCCIHNNSANGIKIVDFSAISSCNLITISNCSIHNNSADGIKISSWQHHIDILNCSVIDNEDDGIEMTDCDYIEMSGCTIFNNTKRNGVALSQVDNSSFSYNTITDSGGPEAGAWSGLTMSMCESNNFTGNYFGDNELYNVYLISNCHYNRFWLNTFDQTGSPNIVNMVDSNNDNNYWNSSQLGNIWYNYGSFSDDDDDNGIGDDPYIIPTGDLTYDYLPIHDDGFNGSAIIIDEQSSHDWAWAESLIWLKGKGTEKNPYVIKDILIDCGNSGSGIYINNSDVKFQIQNCSINNSEWGVFPDYQAAIKIQNTSNGIIFNNNLSKNTGAGVLLCDNSSNNIIMHNNLTYNRHGVYLVHDCHSNQIKHNYINSSTLVGIDISVIPGLEEPCNNTWIFNNTIQNCLWGINLHTGYDANGTIIQFNNIKNNENGIKTSAYTSSYFHHNLTLFDNNITENSIKGIDLAQIDEGYLYQNNISHNVDSNGYGIHLNNSVSNLSVYLNNITNNMGIGLYIDADSNQDNLVYNNTFISNTINGEDNGTSNDWNTTTQGNFWDDYDGFDATGNGFGETPYTVSGVSNAKDFIPEWYIKDLLAPFVTILTPSDNDVYAYDAPSVNLEIDEYVIQSQNYSLDFGSTMIPFTGSNIDIDEDEWDDQGNGTVTIRFYVQDLAGHLAEKDLVLNKDIEKPTIEIIQPNPNIYINNTLLDLNITVFDFYFEETWYSVDGGNHNYTFTGNETIRSGLWTNLEDGAYTLTFYANDSMGNIGTADVGIIKDATDPIIDVVSPFAGTEFHETPAFDVDITELNDYTTWYIILGSGQSSPEYFTGNSGEINTDLWSNLEIDNVYIIRFYIQDTAGNINFDDLSIKKVGPPPEPMKFWVKAMLSGIISAAVSLFIKQSYSIYKKKQEKVKEILEVLKRKDRIYFYVKDSLSDENWREIVAFWREYTYETRTLKKAVEKSLKILGIPFYNAMLQKRDVNDDLSKTLKPKDINEDTTEKEQELETKDTKKTEKEEIEVTERKAEPDLESESRKKKRKNISDNKKDMIPTTNGAFKETNMKESNSAIKLKKYMDMLYNMRDKVKADYEKGIISEEIYIKKQDYIGKKLGECASKLGKLRDMK